MKFSRSVGDTGLTRWVVAFSELVRSARMDKIKALSSGVSSSPR